MQLHNITALVSDLARTIVCLLIRLWYKSLLLDLFRSDQSTDYIKKYPVVPAAQTHQSVQKVGRGDRLTYMINGVYVSH
jgi:hypothetical protein